MTDAPDHDAHEIALRRLRWSCRRGMLENDLLLEHYLHRYARDLDPAALRTLNRLLEYDDVTLWELLSGRRQDTEPELQNMVEAIRAA
jgi:antitoxin CptB